MKEEIADPGSSVAEFYKTASNEETPTRLS